MTGGSTGAAAAGADAAAAGELASGGEAIAGLRLRRGRPQDLEACAAIWVAGIDGYGVGVGRPPLAAPPASLVPLLGHLRATDPDLFLVAARPADPAVAAGPADDTVVAFASALRRAHTWFLAMLFVHPAEQARGLGRRLLEAVLPPAHDPACRATCTDAAQPISNALYARHGIVPRMPVLEIVGRPDRARLPVLAAGLRAVPFEVLGGLGDGTGATPGGDARDVGPRHLATTLAALDEAALGYAHPEDHAFVVTTGRAGYLYVDGDGRAAGYGYVAPSGRVGPIAAMDEGLLPGILGHLLRAVEPAGAFSAWVPGGAGAAVTTLLGAGLRIEDFPALLCWDRPFADFSRYLPISPGLL